MPAKGKGRGKAALNHQHASALPKGIEFKDLRKKPWYVGEPIGSGGFGLIYLAGEEKTSNGADKANFVIKVEPHGNGPLYCEIAFYQRAARQESLEAWRKTKRFSYIGIPPYIAHGLHTQGSENLRFMVMPRFGCDLHSLWLKANKRFQRATVCQLAIELLNSLEYMHENEYVHADIKGANILLGHKDPNQIYLVDFGLAFRYMVEGKHKPYQEDPRKAHDGTIEYTSRDAHKGVAPSRRADLEILGYALLHWLAGKLPWEDNLENKNYVKEQKIKHMSNIKEFISSVLPDPQSKKATEIEKYFQSVSSLDYEEKPDYKLLRKYFQDALKSMNVSLKSKIDFGSEVESTPAKKKRTIRSRTKPLLSATNMPTSQSSQSEDEVVPKKRSRQPPRKRKEQSSLEKDLSFEASSATSEDSTKKVVRNPRKRTAVTAKSPTRKKVENPVKKKIVKSSSDENAFSDYYTEQNGQFSSNSTAKKVNKKLVGKQLPAKQSIHSSDEIEISTGSENGTDEAEVNISTSDATSPRTRSSVRNSPQKSISAGSSKSKSSSISKSRYSMAPLHTKSVLGKDDSLSGKYSGKHPVLIRRRKVKRPGMDVTTQTTPSLDKRASRV